MKTKIPHLILAGLLGSSAAHAATIAIDDANTARIVSDAQDGSGSSATTHTMFVGTKANGAGWDGAGGIAFQMTGASAADLTAANFSISVVSIQGTPAYNVDVYVNRVSPSSAFLATDYEVGTKIMDDFVTTSDGAGNYSLNGAGQTNLLNYLSTNWVEDDYVFITLKGSSLIMGQDANHNINFGGSITTWAPGGTDAQLTITAVPEPSSAALIGLGGVALILRRRR